MPGSEIPMSGNPVGGGGQLNTAIPMAGMGQMPVQSVKPMGVVDINAVQSEQKQREAIDAQADTELQKKADADHDKMVFEMYRSSGGKGDLVTPQGIQTTLKDIGHQMSSTGFNNITDLYGKKQAADLQLQKMLFEKDKDDKEKVVGDIEFAQGNLNRPMVEAFYSLDPVSGHYVPKKEGSYEEKYQAFQDAKTRAIEIAKNMKNPDGTPRYNEASLKNLISATPEQAVHVYESTNYFQTRVKESVEEDKKKAEAELARRKADYMRDRLKNGPQDSAKLEAKTMLVEGEAIQVNFHPSTGRYTTPTGEDVTALVKPLEKGGMTPQQLGTVEKDIFEAKKFLEKTKPGQTSSLFFLDETSDKSAVRRFTENKMTRQESQLYDIYANRVANAIVGMQSLGRYRGAVKSIDEARKLVPAPGDTEATIKAKREYIEEFTRDTDDELSKLSKGHKREKLMQEKLDKTKPVIHDELSPEDLKLLDMYSPESK
jgi:hypothetical protein